MHADRIAAEKKYRDATKAFHAAANGTDEAAFYAADEARMVAMREWIATEEKYPTPKESKRAANVLRLRNRGMDA